jgi:glutaredoxin
MKPQCYLISIYLNWIVYLGGLAYLVFGKHDLRFAAVWLIAVPLFQLAYVRLFPHISAAMGYGRVDDQNTAPPAPAPQDTHVRFYVALGCPFCPVVEKRLRALQQRMGFEIEKIEVTYRPELLSSKGIRAVPVVEVGDRRIVGHATTDQLIVLISPPASPS